MQAASSRQILAPAACSLCKHLLLRFPVIRAQGSAARGAVLLPYCIIPPRTMFESAAGDRFLKQRMKGDFRRALETKKGEHR